MRGRIIRMYGIMREGFETLWHYEGRAIILYSTMQGRAMRVYMAQ